MGVLVGMLLDGLSSVGLLQILGTGIEINSQ